MKKNEGFITSTTARISEEEKNARADFTDYYLNRNPIPDEERLDNLALFVKRRELGRILFMNEIYKKIVEHEIVGVVIEFGCRWGRNLVLFQNLRGLYEPYMVGRKIIGFDTFSGFPDSITEKDGYASHMVAGGHSVTPGYEQELDCIMSYHEKESPISHIKKYELIKGDVTKTFPDYMDKHPETLIALAYFDLDLYQPTKDCLKEIITYMPKGAIIGFDDLTSYGFPGETIAFKELLGANNYEVHYSKTEPSCSYIVL